MNNKFIEKTRIAVVGVGLGGATHIRCLKSSNDANLEAIIAPISPRNTEIAQNENVPIFKTIQECLSNCRIDGVIIASPNTFHAEHTKVCIDAKIPVLLEKPITATIKEGLELVQAVEDKNAKVLIGHHRAHNPILKSAIEVISSGRLGEIVSIMGSAQFHKPSHYFNDGPWRKELGGGPILINLIHEIDNLRRLLGEIKEVQAMSSNNIRRFSVEDSVAINFIFESGAIGSFILSDTASTSRSWEQTTGENPSYPRYVGDDCYLIAGTKGSLAVPTMRLQSYPNGVDPSWWTPFKEEVIKVDRLDPLNCQLAHFIEIIRKNVNPLVTARDGYKNLLITEAIRDSARTKSVIKVSL